MAFPADSATRQRSLKRDGSRFRIRDYTRYSHPEPRIDKAATMPHSQLRLFRMHSHYAKSNNKHVRRQMMAVQIVLGKSVQATGKCEEADSHPPQICHENIYRLK